MESYEEFINRQFKNNIYSCETSFADEEGNSFRASFNITKWKDEVQECIERDKINDLIEKKTLFGLMIEDINTFCLGGKTTQYDYTLIPIPDTALRILSMNIREDDTDEDKGIQYMLDVIFSKSIFNNGKVMEGCLQEGTDEMVRRFRLRTVFDEDGKLSSIITMDWSPDFKKLK